MKTFMDKRVIVDDGCPVAANAEDFTTTFGPGAIALGNGNPVGRTTEVARDGLAGEITWST